MAIKDDLIFYGAIGAGVFLLYEALKNGLFGSGASDLLTGKYGAEAGTKFYGTNLTPNYNPLDYSSYNPAYGSGHKTIADVVYNTPTLNVTATDTAFAKIGLTTQKYEYLISTYGQDWYISFRNNFYAGTLTQSQINVLNSVAWDSSVYHGNTSSLTYVSGVGLGAGAY